METQVPGMGRRELVAAGAVFPPQAPRLGPVAGRAGAWCQCSAVPPPSLALQPTSRLQTQHRDRGQDRGIVTLEQSSLCLQLETNPSEVCTITEKAEGRSRGLLLLRDCENSVKFVSSFTAAPRDVKWSRNNESQHCWSQCSAV